MVKKVRAPVHASLNEVDNHQAYIIGKNDEHYSEMLSNIHGIIFLSTPHRGSLHAHALNNLLSATVGTSRKVYIAELERNSTSLEDLNEQFCRVCGALQLVSLYETLPTTILPKIKKKMVGSCLQSFSTLLIDTDCWKRLRRPGIPKRDLQPTRC